MERADYLRLCQRNAVEMKHFVNYGGKPYLPIAYLLKFDGRGEPIHIAIMRESENAEDKYLRLKYVAK